MIASYPCHDLHPGCPKARRLLLVSCQAGVGDAFHAAWLALTATRLLDSTSTLPALAALSYEAHAVVSIAHWWPWAGRTGAALAVLGARKHCTAALSAAALGCTPTAHARAVLAPELVSQARGADRLPSASSLAVNAAAVMVALLAPAATVLTAGRCTTTLLERFHLNIIMTIWLTQFLKRQSK